VILAVFWVSCAILGIVVKTRRIIMKKLCIIAVILLLPIMSFGATSPYDLTALSGTNASAIQDSVKGLSDMLTTGLNSGMYPLAFPGSFSIGVQATLMPVAKEGIYNISTDPASYTYIPFVFAALKLPVGLGVFARGLIIPGEGEGGADITVYGGGVGFDLEKLIPLPLISVKAYVSAHFVNGVHDFSFSTYSAQLVAAIKWLPVLTPFAEVGIAASSMKVSKDQLSLTEEVSFSNAPIKVAVGAEVFGFASLSVNILPDISYNLSVRLKL